MAAKRKNSPRSASAAAASGARTGTGERAPVSIMASMDAWDRIVWVCLHAFVILVPIAMSNLGPFNANGVPFTYDQFDIVKVFLERAIMLVALGAWAAGLLVRGGKIRWSKVEWLIGAFLAWVALTSALSIHPATAILGKYRRFEGLISFLLYAAVFFVALQLVDRTSRLRSIARSVAIGGFLVAAYGAIQVVGTVGLPVARVLQPLSLVIALGVPALVAWYTLAKAHDIETRRSLVIGALIALAGGVWFYAGLVQNIERAVAAGSQVVSLDPVWWGQLPFETNRAFSMFGNPDLLGGYLIFPWAIALGLALTEKHLVWRTTYWVFTVLNVFVGITSYVRGAWIGAAVSLIAIVVAFLRAKKGTALRLEPVDRLFIGTAAATAAVIAVVTSTRPDAVRNVATRIVSIFQFGEGSALTRFQIWDAAWRAIAERPVFGWGADTFRLLFPMFKPAEYVAAAGYISVADNVHNYPLQLASGIGVPGALALYALVAWALVTSARECFTTGRGTERLLLAGFWAGALGYMVHLFFGLSVTGSTVFLWLGLGVLLSPIASTKEVASPRWRAPALGVLAAIVIVASVLNVRFIIADNHYLKGRVLATDVQRVTEIQRAIELNPYNDMYRLELGAAWQDIFRQVVRAYAEQSGGGSPQLQQQMLDTFSKAEAAYLDTIDFVPYEYDTYVFLANLYNEGASYIGPQYADKAIEIARRGVEVEEYGPAIRVQLAVAYMTKGQLDEAVKELEYAVELDPRYSQARLLLGRAYEESGRYADAKAQYEAILAAFPDNTPAAQALESLEASLASAPARP